MVAETATIAKPMPRPKASPAANVNTEPGTSSTVPTMCPAAKISQPYGPRLLIQPWKASDHSSIGSRNQPATSAAMTTVTSS